jgi:predicted transcriptional regulator
MSGVEIAKTFGVSKGAVSKNLKSLTKAISQDIILREAEKINNKQLSAMDRLEKMSQDVDREVDLINEELEVTAEGGKNELREIKLKYRAEGRKQTNTKVDLGKMMYDMSEVRKFQETLIEILGEMSIEKRDEFLRRLKERRALGSVFRRSESGI